jgi:peptidoglycan/xylan/chitin deacetylase (PgdA/CDA1 family)
VLRQVVGRSLARLAADERPRCLLFHDMVPLDVRDPEQMTVPADLFEAQLDALTDIGWHIADAAWCVRRMRSGKQIPPRTVVLTFDDGLAGTAVAAPALLERGITATLFITPGIVEGRVASARPGLDAAALRGLLATGAFVAGVHGMSHVPLARLDDEALMRETAAARDAAVALTGTACELFAYPYGSFGTWNARSAAAVARAGYLGAFTSVFGPLRGDPYRLSRCRVSWADGVADVRAIVSGGHDWYRWIQWAQAIV